MTSASPALPETPEEGTTVRQTMTAGREMDADVAEKVFGATVHQGLYDDYMTLPHEGMVSGQKPIPWYSRDIAAAWHVVEAMADLKPHPWGVTVRNFRYYGDRTYSATFRCASPFVAPVHAEADSLAEAICRAALAAVESPHVE